MKSTSKHIPVRTSLRVKVTLGVLLPLILILGLFTVIEYERYKAALQANLSLLASQTGQVIEDNLRRQMLKSDPDGVQDIMDAMGQREAFQAILVLDTKGKVIFAPEGEGVGTRLSNDMAACQPCHNLPADERPSSVLIEDENGQRMFRSMHPLENDPECVECHDADDRLLGLLLTDIPTTPLEASLQANIRENLYWWLGTVLVTVIVVNLAISQFVLQRLEGLLAGITGLGQGRPPAPLPETEPDEIGQLTNEFNAMVHKVEARRIENEALSERLQRQNTERGEMLQSLITAQEDERKRVAMELHDDLGQALGGLALRAEAVERLITTDHEKALAQLGEMRGMVMETTERMYNLILALRPSVLDDLGLVPALRAHAERSLQDTGIEHELDASELKRRLPPVVETALFRTAQEAITNVIRHSEATCVRIQLACDRDHVTAEISDNGCGFDPTAVGANGRDGRGLGLRGMQERITLCGGQLKILSQPGAGTTVKVDINLDEVGCG